MATIEKTLKLDTNHKFTFHKSEYSGGFLDIYLETVQPAQDYHLSDREVDIDISVEQAKQIIAFLQEAIK